MLIKLNNWVFVQILACDVLFLHPVVYKMWVVKFCLILQSKVCSFALCPEEMPETVCFIYQVPEMLQVTPKKYLLVNDHYCNLIPCILYFKAFLMIVLP